MGFLLTQSSSVPLTLLVFSFVCVLSWKGPNRTWEGTFGLPLFVHVVFPSWRFGPDYLLSNTWAVAVTGTLLFPAAAPHRNGWQAHGLQEAMSPEYPYERKQRPVCKEGDMAVGQNQWYHFGIGAPPIVVCFSWGLGCSLGGTLF